MGMPGGPCEYRVAAPLRSAPLAQARRANGGNDLLRLNKENVPLLTISVWDLSVEMSKHVEERHEPALRALLVALKMGLGLEGFCRRVRLEMGTEVLQRTLRGLIDELAQRPTVRDMQVPALRDERVRALAAAKRRFSEREEAVPE